MQCLTFKILNMLKLKQIAENKFFLEVGRSFLINIKIPQQKKWKYTEIVNIKIFSEIYPTIVIWGCNVYVLLNIENCITLFWRKS